MTSTVHDPIELLRNTLEEQFQRSTEQLAELTVRSQQPNGGGYDDDTLAALIASARRAVADTAQALRRMAEGSYGSCERCTADIPLQRLEILPHARFCVPCQGRQTGRAATRIRVPRGGESEMEKWSLQALADGLLRHALSGSSRRGTRTVNRGHPRSPGQAMIALGCGQRLEEHGNRGEATVQVLRGRVRVTAGDDVTHGAAGQLLMVPDGRSTVTALEDTVVLLTVAEHPSPRDAAPAGAGPCRRIPAPSRAMPSRGYGADRAPTTFDREMNP